MTKVPSSGNPPCCHRSGPDVEFAESVSFAMLTVRETLGPTGRAVFVLREVFEPPYDEIAEAVGRTPAAVRQFAHRAREQWPRDRPRVRVSRAGQEAVVEAFVATVRGGDVQGCWTCSRRTSSNEVRPHPFGLPGIDCSVAAASSLWQTPGGLFDTYVSRGEGIERRGRQPV
ncbi:sigma factor-like helix-turn-helix DNA-binding protein [Micromonospora sp. NPDC023814]|uniref:sigma factor-like helix-turn-helix DNA-binding protein n=1 Tax=Micromonospora sp. NPDC023814 TaxID=3154596 RepID=UPI0033E164E8